MNTLEAPRLQRDDLEQDPVDVFLEAATLPPKKVQLAEIPKLRLAAMETLEARYGPFNADHIEKIFEIPETILDPIERFIVVSEISKWGWTHRKKMDRLRNQRRMGIMVLYHDFGLSKADIVKLLDPKKQRDARFVDLALKGSDRRDRSKWSKKKAEETALKAHTEYTFREDASKWARTLRDPMMIELSEGRWDGFARLTDEEWEAGERGRGWSNAELARLASMSTAAVAIERRKASQSLETAA